MFIRKVDGPRAVTLPDGTIMTRADLPPPDTRRWVASRKAAVGQAVDCGLISAEEAMATWIGRFLAGLGAAPKPAPGRTGSPPSLPPRRPGAPPISSSASTRGRR